MKKKKKNFSYRIVSFRIFSFTVLPFFRETLQCRFLTLSTVLFVCFLLSKQNRFLNRFSMFGLYTLCVLMKQQKERLSEYKKKFGFSLYKNIDLQIPFLKVELRHNSHVQYNTSELKRQVESFQRRTQSVIRVTVNSQIIGIPFSVSYSKDRVDPKHSLYGEGRRRRERRTNITVSMVEFSINVFLQ